MNLSVFIFVITASLLAGNAGSCIPSMFQDAENTEYAGNSGYRKKDDGILDDIIPDNLSRYAVKNRKLLWPDGIVPFKIQKQFDHARVGYIHRAMREISRVSCIRFIDAPKNATTFLSIKVSSEGCRANMGYVKYVTRLLFLALDELDTGCFTIGSIIHELMHVLGFIHPHIAPDRDKYVKIIRENIAEYAFPEFEKYNPGYITDLGLPYDFGSVMHYPLDAHSKNGNLTIQPIVDPGPVLVFGQTEGLSTLDIAKLNRLYKCCL